MDDGQRVAYDKPGPAIAIKEGSMSQDYVIYVAVEDPHQVDVDAIQLAA